MSLEITIENEAPTVEIDTDGPAAYIRLRKGLVARTVITRDDGEILASVDLDEKNQPIGIEVVWPQKFNIDYLLAEAGVTVSANSCMPYRVDYIKAGSRPVSR